MSGNTQTNTTSVADLVNSLRTERGDFLSSLSSGSIPSTSVYARIQGEPALHQLYVVKIVESLPLIGKVHARRALGSLGIDELSPAIEVDEAAWGVLIAGAGA